MTCGGCARSVERSVKAVPGVLEVSVDLPARTVNARVEPGASEDAMRQAVRRAGFEVLR